MNVFDNIILYSLKLLQNHIFTIFIVIIFLTFYFFVWQHTFLTVYSEQNDFSHYLSIIEFRTRS